MLGAVPGCLVRMDLSLAKNCEEKTGKQTAEAENDVPETKATCSCLPGVSKNTKTKETKREMKHKEMRGGGVLCCSPGT